MENIYEPFLTALRAALRGEKAELTLTGEQWSSLLKLAELHKVLPMVLDAVHGCPGLEAMDQGQLLLYRRQARHHVLVQTLRTEEFLKLNRTLGDRGIKPLVVKGLICRELYPQPDLRPSGDEDVLVPPAQFDACRGILTELGLESTGEPDAYELPFRKPGSYLYIELHRQLFPPEAEAYGEWNRFFTDAFDRAAAVEVRGTRVMTLDPGDHLFFLICHAFKHFLHGGFGIRQVCDLALFGEKYAPEVDWQRVLENCEAIRGAKFAAALFRIGEKHLGIPAPAAFRDVAVDEMPMLLDLLAGGLYGGATASRKFSAGVTLKAVEDQKRGRDTRSGLLPSLFPSAKRLTAAYPYLADKPWLLPVAWGQRLWRHSRAPRTASQALRLGRERLDLLRQYDILD